MASSAGFRLNVVGLRLPAGSRDAQGTATGGRFATPGTTANQAIDKALQREIDGAAKSLVKALEKATPEYQERPGERPPGEVYQHRKLREGWRYGISNSSDGTVTAGIRNIAQAPGLKEPLINLLIGGARRGQSIVPAKAPYLVFPHPSGSGLMKAASVTLGEITPRPILKDALRELDTPWSQTRSRLQKSAARAMLAAIGADGAAEEV